MSDSLVPGLVAKEVLCSLRLGPFRPSRGPRISDLTNSHRVYIMIYTMLKTAKLFRNGRSQAVRLPVEYRFEGSEVYVRRDPASGDVILSRRPESWTDLFALIKLNAIEMPADFLADREDAPPQKRELF
jgi:antitoxin VapB